MALEFQARKRAALEDKKDKSFKGSLDPEIAGLCAAINALPDFFTSSSCSGRVCLLQVSGRNDKKHSQWIYLTHGPAQAKEAWQALAGYQGPNRLFFRQEPPILHVYARTLALGSKLLGLAEERGFSKSGFLSAKEPAVLELGSSERLEVPVYDQRFLVDEAYMEYLVKLANEKLGISREKIRRLETGVAKGF